MGLEAVALSPENRCVGGGPARLILVDDGTGGQMLRAMMCTSVLLAFGLSVTACGPRTAAPVQPDQSKVFFPGTVETYGLDLTPTDRDHLAERYALRQIDPCGFVDQKTLEGNGHKDFSYTYSSVSWIETGANSPIATLGGEGCTVRFPATKAGLELLVRPGEVRWNDSQFSSDPAHRGVLGTTPPGCTFRVPLPLAGLTGAPESMRDPVVEVSAVDVTDGRRNSEDTELCELGGAVADEIAAHVEANGVPVHADKSSTATRFLTADPCAAAADLHAVGFEWWEPKPEAQWPTTWRHPGVCELQLDPAAGESTTAVVKYGLVKWSDDIVKMPWSPESQRSEQDGVTLFDVGRSSGPDCYVIANTNRSIEPVTVGTGAADLVASTPIVTVRVNAPTAGNCAGRAKEAALRAVQRAG